METIGDAGLAAVRADIARACREAGRDPQSVTLVAVSKTFGADAIEPVIAEGQRVFGENRVQEAKSKWPALMTRHPRLELHLVGSLQSNKAREAVALFDAIHSLDRASLAEALGKEIARQHGSPCCSSRSTPARSHRRPASCRNTPMRFSRLPRRLWAHSFRVDVCPAGQRGPCPALRAHRADRPPQRACASVHGHERRFSGSDRVWRDACPRRHGDLRHRPRPPSYES